MRATDGGARGTSALVVALSLALSATGCGARPPTADVPTRPERLVLVVGESADALGVERARSADDRSARVALHDGSETWVESWRVRELELVPGSRLVVRQGASLVIARALERLDRMALVELGEGAQASRVLAPIGDVIAVLRRSATLDDATPPRDPGGGSGTTDPQTPPPPPPIDPARVVAFDGASVWAVARMAGCSGGQAAVLRPGGEVLRVPFARVAAVAVAAGDRVRAPWEGTSYPAMVLETRGGMVHIQWEDGSDAWMPAEQLLEVLRAAPAAAQGTGGRGARPASCLRAGAPVLVHLGRQRLVGVIEGCAGRRATLVRPDGSRDARPLEALERARLEPGTSLEARWRDAATYRAEAIAEEGDQVRVRWEDGSEEAISVATVVSYVAPADAPAAAAAEPPACP